MKGNIFNIQRFSIHDGPSIRTAVFFKGCPLRCAWCHNPEGLTSGPVLSCLTGRCIGCCACEAVCDEEVHSFAGGRHTLNRDKCISCGKCAEVCPAGALEIVGREYTVDEVVEAALRDRLFYRDGGGVTLTGGEPLMQGAFAVTVAQIISEKGISVCVETSGYAESQVVRDIAPYVDIFLFDIKETDEARHKEFTGVGLERIHSNLRLMDDMGKRIILRCPMIPGVNDREAHFEAIADIANSLKHIIEIKLEPYHPMGIEKSRRIGGEAAYRNEAFMEQAEAEVWREYLAGKTDVPVIIM